jgi:hypothetical protein
MFRNIEEFAKDAGEWGIASWVTALAMFAIAVWEHIHDKPVSAFILVCVTVPLFWIGSYFAWSKKKQALENERSSHDGPEISLSWPTTRPANTRAALFVENTGSVDAYEIKVSDIGINKTHCAARFHVIPKCPKNSRILLAFELVGDGVPQNHMDDLEMVVYASQSNKTDEHGELIVDFPITVTFEEYGGARYETHFRVVADPFLSKVNIHRVSRRRIPSAEN